MLITRGFLTILFLFGLASPATLFSADIDLPDPKGQVMAFQAVGKVIQYPIGQKPADGKELKRGQKFSEGTAIRTGKGSKVMLLFSNGSSLNVGENSELALETFRQETYSRDKGSFLRLKEDPSKSVMFAKLTYGKLVGNVKKLTEASAFEVKTEVGRAIIKGTTFFVAFGRKPDTEMARMQVSNLKGTVEVDSPYEVKIISADGSVLDRFNPYSGPSVDEVPQQTIALVEAEVDLNFDLPEIEEIEGYDDLEDNTAIKDLITEINQLTQGTIDTSNLENSVKALSQ